MRRTVPRRRYWPRRRRSSWRTAPVRSCTSYTWFRRSPSFPRSSARELSEALLDRRKLNALRLLDHRTSQIEAEFGGSVAASHYRDGTPEKEVLRLAEEFDAGLIMTGGKRRPWYERAFEAGFSERLSRRAERIGLPVLIVGEKAARGSAVPRR